MPVSNQTRHRPASAAMIAACGLVLLAVAAWLVSMLWPPAGVLLVVGVFGVCGLTRGRRQRTTSLPRPVAAPLPPREPVTA